MKKIPFLFLFLYATAVQAQEFNVKSTPSFKLKGDFSDEFFGFNDIYLRYSIEQGPMQFAYSATLKKIRFGINLYTYSAGMKEMKNISLDNNKKRLGPFKPTPFTYNGKFYILYYRYEEDADVIKLYMAQIDPIDLVIEKTATLFTIDQQNLWILKAEDAISNNNLFIRFSPDSSKILITSCNKQMIYSCVADKQFNISQNTVIKSKITKDITIADAFIDNAGNKFYSYNYVPAKDFRRGLITESYKGGPAKFQDYKTMEQGFEANDLYFANSKDNSKIYIHANYYKDFLNEGVLLTTINTNDFSVSEPKLFPYPDDFKTRMEKEHFAEKQKGNLSVRRTDYTLYELNDGVIAFIGSPRYSVNSQSSLNNTTITSTSTYVGPIINIFIYPGKNPAFNILPRYTYGSATSSYFSRVYNNQIQLLYCDEEKNLDADLSAPSKYTKHEVDMVLASAMLDNNGNVIKRQKIADVPGDGNYYFFSDARKIDNSSFLIPVGRSRVNMAKYYQQVEKMVVLEIR